MLGTQIAFTMLSAIAALVIAYSTWTFHQWTRKQHQPDPVLADQVIEIDAKDAGEVSVQARLLFLNPGPVPIYIERVGMGLRGLDRNVQHAFAGGDGRIDPGETKLFPVGHTWPRPDLAETREAIIDVLFTAGTRGGELLISGLEVRSASVFPERGPNPYSAPLSLVTFPGTPAPARYPVFSYTYPTTAFGRFRYRILSRFHQTPSQRFRKWCRRSANRK